MTHPIIKTENYLLVVDESEIKEDDWVFNSHKVEFAPQIFKMPPHPIEGEWWDEEELSTTKKIIFHLPLNNAPTLEGVPLLPPLEDEIIQSLQQPKYPVAFESTIGVCSKWLAEHCDNNCCGKPEKIITITNSQGFIQVVGNYIYDQITTH
jgi:hypothetical protein